MKLSSAIVVSLLGAVIANPAIVFPRINSYTAGNYSVSLNENIQIDINTKSHRLRDAVKRHYNQIVESRWVPIVPTFQATLNPYSPRLNRIKVEVGSDNETLDDTTDESYELHIKVDGGNAEATLKASTIYGAMHGFESFAQMVQCDIQSQTQFIPKAPLSIKDAPLHPHRGLLLDTSRNYYPISDIKRTIRALSMNKMNVFHWHMVDSHSWPFQSEKRPKLSKVGALLNQIYTVDDIKSVVKYGLDRGVRVIPELEAPAHSYAIGKAYPELATCMDDDQWTKMAAEPPSGQIDPTNPLSLEIVNDLIDEFSTIFDDKYIHLSGDEVNLNCWNSSEKIRDHLHRHNMELSDLLTDFAKKMHHRATENKKSIMVWEEIVLNHQVELPKDSLVQVWLGAGDTKKVIERGYRVVASSYQYWYLDCGHGAWLGDSPSGSSWCDPFKHWQLMYSYDLHANLTASQRHQVAGGEVAIWSEQVDPNNLDLVAWPRTSAAAEVLWSGNYIDDKFLGTKAVLPRLNNFRFRLVSHGIRAEPLQPLWCVMNPGRCDSDDSLKKWQLPYRP